ncbi:MAG: V-type ATPase subunit [Synergistaceae bacterium]
MPITAHGQAIAVGVKSHVLYSRLLTAADYWNLLNLKTTTEISNFLRDTEGYKDALSGLSTDHVHRVDLQNALKTTVRRVGTAFLPYISGPMFKLFTSCLAWYEAEELKNIFRWIRSRRLTPDEMKQKLSYMECSKIPFYELIDSTNFDDALEKLKDTKYFKVLKEPVKKLMGGEKSLFSLELAIDNLVETEICKNLNELPFAERSLLEPLFGLRLDLLNLYHFHRCSIYYHMTIEEILSQMLSVSYKVKFHHLREMSEGKTWQEHLEILEQLFPVYANIFSEALNHPDKELALETSIERYKYKMTLSVFQKGAPGFHTAMAYFLIKTQEVDDIIRIIENVRYGYSRDESAAYLIRPITDGGVPIWQ